MADGSLITPEPSTELKKLGHDVHNAISTLQDAIKTGNADTLKKAEDFFRQYEDENQKLAKSVALHQKAQADLEEALKEADKKASEAGIKSAEAVAQVRSLEMVLSKKGGGGGDRDPREADEYKGFWDFLKKDTKPANGYTSFRPDIDVKTLRTDSEVQGGYLIPQVMDAEIRKNITEISPVRLFARVRTAPNKTMDIPRRLSIPTAAYEGEGETSPSDQSTYGSEQVTLYRQTVTVPATLDMMVSSAFDLEREIAADVGESFGKGEGTNYISGLGIKSPQGFIKDTRCEVVTTASSGVMDFTDLSVIMGKLKRGQNPWWYFNRRTLSAIQAIKSTIGVPIWQPVAGNTPATIWGFPYSSDMIDLDDVQNGSNAKPVVFADLRRGYEIYDMVGISVIRDDLTRKKEAITEWTFRRYNTGRVIIPEAIKILKVL